MGKAAGSARGEYERQQALYRERVRRMLPLVIGLGLVMATVGWLLADQFIPTVRLWVALLFKIATVGILLPNRRAMTKPRRGALRRRKVAAELEKLPPQYVVIHDVKMPSSQENIDHIVFGPSGVFVIETKTGTGLVTVEDNTINLGGRETNYVEQVWQRATAVQMAVGEILATKGLEVQPILSFTKAKLPLGHPNAAGILLLGPKATRRHILGLEKILSKEEIGDLISQASRILPLRDAM